MSDINLPDHKTDIRKEAEDLVYLLDRLFQGYGYRDETGEIKVWHDDEIDELARKFKLKHPSHLMNWDSGEMSTEENYDFDVNFLDWLDEQLWHEGIHNKDGEVIGWNIEITVGGPTVYLRKEAFTNSTVFFHSWGVEISPSKKILDRTRIELNSPTGIYVANEITDIFNEVICNK